MKPRHSDVTMAPAHSPGACKVAGSILSRVGDKWTVFLVMMLAKGPRRFNELKRDIGGISQRMLTLTLRGLERDGLVTRTMFATVPPRMDLADAPGAEHGDAEHGASSPLPRIVHSRAVAQATGGQTEWRRASASVAPLAAA